MDEVDGAVYQYLMGARNSQLPSTDLEKLVSRGYLTERSVEEEREYIKKIAGIFYRHVNKTISIVFAVTFSCQMRCIYCYESYFVHKENETSLKTMTSEHVKNAYAAIDKIVERDSNKIFQNGITLYGGEPLMAKNYEIVREIVEEGIRRKYTFSAITNGYDLVKFEELLGLGKIQNLQITLDGPEAVHNKRRFAKGGVPTFDRIVEGVQLALDKGCTVSLRTNIDHKNAGALAELNRFYHEKGWNQNRNFYPYAFVTHAIKGQVMQPMELLTSLDRIYEGNTVDNKIQVNFGIESSFSALFNRGNIPTLRPYFCSSNIGSYIFAPDGNIYTCWEELTMEDGIVGHYMPELVLNDARLSEWQDRTTDKIPECLACPYVMMCGGGCGRQAKVTNGSLLTPYCFQFQETFPYVVPSLYENYTKRLQKQEEVNNLNKGNDVCG
jgi:uncharacterized protein